MSYSGSDEEGDDFSNRNSIFSDGKPSTVSTRPSTVPSKNSFGSATGTSKIGKSLRITNNENLEQDSYKLKILSESLTQFLDQFDSKTPIFIVEALNKFETPSQPENFVSPENLKYLHNIIKVILTLVDNILANNETYRTSRFMILKGFNQFAKNCNFVNLMKKKDGSQVNNFEGELFVTEPNNYCLVDEGDTKISQIIDTIAQSESSMISDQDGAFLAPVSRGFSDELSIPTIICGLPKPGPEHHEQIKQLCSNFTDIHFVVQKNYIKPCSFTGATNASDTNNVNESAGHGNNAGGSSPFINQNFGGIVPPFRIPVNQNSVPISLSIASNSNSKLSGTLGGYLYPKIDPKKNNFVRDDVKATYAITCAHVCIDDSTAHPYVSVPSPVLIRLYKDALVKERSKYPKYSQEFRGYNSALGYLEQKFPDIDDVDSEKTGNFGRVIFGERAIVNGRISDIAIIKCNPTLDCMNHLGTDFPFSQYDPSLLFGNLQIKRIINKIKPGSSVFKFGSTTRFTTGKLNKPKLVYWADNRIQSSEFIIASDRPGFASGGDSGAWILQKLEDFEGTDEAQSPQQQQQSQQSRTQRNLGTIYESSNTNGTGLGVVGMLHACDGEYKQFGVYTPIVIILNRLQELTKVPWGVVGVVDEKDETNDDDDESSEGEDTRDNSENDEFSD